MAQAITFFTDGSCKPPPKTRGRGMMGAGVVGVCGIHQKTWSVPLGPGTSQLAELLAVREALKALGNRPGTAVTVFSDSQYAVGVLTQHHTVNAHQEVVNEIKGMIAECASFQMQRVPGHSGDPMNEMAHKLAFEAASSQDPSSMPPAPPNPPRVSDQLREIAQQFELDVTHTVPPEVRAGIRADRLLDGSRGPRREEPSPEVREAIRTAEEYEQQLAHLQIMITQMTNALQFYGDPINWQRRPEICQALPAIVMDKGFVARHLLMIHSIPIAEDPFDGDPAAAGAMASQEPRDDGPHE